MRVGIETSRPCHRWKALGALQSLTLKVLEKMCFGVATSSPRHRTDGKRCPSRAQVCTSCVYHSRTPQESTQTPFTFLQRWSLRTFGGYLLAFRPQVCAIRVDRTTHGGVTASVRYHSTLSVHTVKHVDPFDLCARVNKEGGYETLVVKNATFVHTTSLGCDRVDMTPESSGSQAVGLSSHGSLDVGERG